MGKTRSKDQIYSLLKSYQTSGLNQKQFSEKYNIKYNTFQTWIWRYKSAPDFPLRRVSKKPQVSNFVELKPKATRLWEKSITIVYPNQVSLSLSMDLQKESISKLKQLLICLD